MSEIVNDAQKEAHEELGNMIEQEILTYTATLGADVTNETHGTATSIKRKRKNFVYIDKGKRVPIKISVKDATGWKKLELKVDDNFAELKAAIIDSYNQVAPKTKDTA
jgi:hypothetical protein